MRRAGPCVVCDRARGSSLQTCELKPTTNHTYDAMGNEHRVNTEDGANFGFELILVLKRTTLQISHERNQTLYFHVQDIKRQVWDCRSNISQQKQS